MTDPVFRRAAGGHEDIPIGVAAQPEEARPWPDRLRALAVGHRRADVMGELRTHPRKPAEPVTRAARRPSRVAVHTAILGASVRTLWKERPRATAVENAGRSDRRRWRRRGDTGAVRRSERGHRRVRHGARARPDRRPSARDLGRGADRRRRPQRGCALSTRSGLSRERARLGPDDWVRGWGLDYAVFPVGEIEAAWVEEAVGGAAAVLVLFDPHTAVATSRALALAGIDGFVYLLYRRAPLHAQATGASDGEGRRRSRGQARRRSRVIARDPLMAAGAQLVLGGVGALAVAGLAGEPGRFEPDADTAASVAGLLFLVGVGSVLALSTYTWLLRHAPISKVATHAYVNPVVAIALGWALLGEALTLGALAAAAGIVASVAVVIRERPRRVVQEPSHQGEVLASPRSNTLRRAAPALGCDDFVTVLGTGVALAPGARGVTRRRFAALKRATA